MIAGLTPEQVLTVRPIFERKMVDYLTEGDPYAPAEPDAEAALRAIGAFNLMPDGFSYADPKVKVMWEAFIMGYSEYKKEQEDADSITGSTVHEDLRRMRQYSKCFTTAFDRKQPVFVLIPQDETAWKGIAQWVVSNTPHLGASHPKIISAKATMTMFREWKDQKKAD